LHLIPGVITVYAKESYLANSTTEKQFLQNDSPHLIPSLWYSHLRSFKQTN